MTAQWPESHCTIGNAGTLAKLLRAVGGLQRHANSPAAAVAVGRLVRGVTQCRPQALQAASRLLAGGFWCMAYAMADTSVPGRMSGNLGSQLLYSQLRQSQASRHAPHL